MSSKLLSKLLWKYNKANSHKHGVHLQLQLQKKVNSHLDQLAPWSTRTLIFHTLIYLSQLALHTIFFHFGQVATW